MSLDVDISTDLQLIEDLFNEDVMCNINYTDCDIIGAAWIADGECPECHDKCFGRLICDPCHSNIQSGMRMSHSVCGYRGKGIEFFPTARKL